MRQERRFFFSVTLIHAASRSCFPGEATRDAEDMCIRISGGRLKVEREGIVRGQVPNVNRRAKSLRYTFLENIRDETVQVKIISCTE